MPKRYLLRAVKSVLLFFVLALLFLLLIYLTASNAEQPVDFWTFIRPNLSRMGLFLAFFGLVYPFIGYISYKIPRTDGLSEKNKADIIALFSNARFVLKTDDNGKMVFHHISPIARFTRVYEDVITVDYSTHTIVVEGLRRDAYRLSRAIEAIVD